jgi:hypothetical protein
VTEQLEILQPGRGFISAHTAALAVARIEGRPLGDVQSVSLAAYGSMIGVGLTGPVEFMVGLVGTATGHSRLFLIPLFLGLATMVLYSIIIPVVTRYAVTINDRNYLVRVFYLTDRQLRWRVEQMPQRTRTLKQSLTKIQWRTERFIVYKELSLLS